MCKNVRTGEGSSDTPLNTLTLTHLNPEIKAGLLTTATDRNKSPDR